MESVDPPPIYERSFRLRYFLGFIPKNNAFIMAEVGIYCDVHTLQIFLLPKHHISSVLNLCFKFQISFLDQITNGK